MLLCVYSKLKNIEYCTFRWTTIKHMLPICTEPQTLTLWDTQTAVSRSEPPMSLLLVLALCHEMA
jgi:hypothetical protein